MRVYTIPKAAKKPQEMLAAIVPKETPWAFKLTGEPDKVDKYRDEFRKLVESLSFGDDGSPQWNLPSNWSEEAGNEFTYRSFRLPSDDKLKCTVSKLSLGFDPSELDEAKWQEYVRRNVNRWRGQLLLSSDQTWDDMSGDLEPIEALSMPKARAYYVTLKGQASDSTMPMGGMAGGMAGMSGSMQPPPTNDKPAKRDVDYVLPEGWRKVKPLSVMAIESFEADGTDGSKVGVTFTIAGGDPESNVIRWNGQVSGDPEQAAKALANADKLDINGSPTEVVTLIGSGDSPQAITAATIHWSQRDALFIKMMGPAPAVKEQHEAFMKLVKSVKW